MQFDYVFLFKGRKCSRGFCFFPKIKTRKRKSVTAVIKLVPSTTSHNQATTHRLMTSEGALHQVNSYDSTVSQPDDLDVEDAIQRLTQSLRDAEYAIPLTHGTPIIWRRCKFQAHASPAQFPRDVQYVIDKLRQDKPWSKGRYFPCAYRLTSGDPMIQKIGVDGTREGTPNDSSSNNNNNNSQLLEGCGDGNDPGAGDKLLDLLRKWDIQNVVLCVTCWDDGLRGRLGSRRFRLYLDSAKDVLEKCYIDSVSVGTGSSAGGNSSSGKVRDEEDSMLSGDDRSSSSNMGSRASVNSSNEFINIPSTSGSRTSYTSRGGDGGGSGGKSNSPMSLTNRNDLDNINEMKRTKIPRGTDLHRMYHQARSRFMPTQMGLRNEYKDITHSYIDADAANFPTGVPDGMGNFEETKKGGRVNHFLAVAPEMSQPMDGSGGPSGYTAPDNLSSSSSLALQQEQQEQQQQYYDTPSIPMPSITRNQLDETKQMVRPHELTHRVFKCVAMLLGYRDTTWPGCRQMIGSPNFVREIVLLQPMSIPYDEINDVRDILTELGPSFNPGNVQRQSILAADMLEWCIRIVRAYYVSTAQSSNMEYDDGSRGRRTANTVNEEYMFDNEVQMDVNGGIGAGASRGNGERAAGITYIHGKPKQALAVRVMMMDPNPDYGGQAQAKSPTNAPLHMRNDVGPQPVQQRQHVDMNYLSSGDGGNGGMVGRSRGKTGNTTNRTDRSARSSMNGWGKSRGSKRNEGGDEEIRVNNW